MFFVCLCVCLFVWRKLLANLVAQVIHIYLILAVLGIKVGRFAGAGDLLGASVALIVCFVSLVCLFVLCLLFVCLFVRSYFFPQFLGSALAVLLVLVVYWEQADKAGPTLGLGLTSFPGLVNIS